MGDEDLVQWLALRAWLRRKGSAFRCSAFSCGSSRAPRAKEVLLLASLSSPTSARAVEQVSTSAVLASSACSGCSRPAQVRGHPGCVSGREPLNFVLLGCLSERSL
jgi:hypothetical protein